jgi:hypothetical protein
VFRPKSVMGQRLSKRPGAKRPKCGRATRQIQASLMSHVGPSRKIPHLDLTSAFGAKRKWGAAEFAASVETDPSATSLDARCLVGFGGKAEEAAAPNSHRILRLSAPQSDASPPLRQAVVSMLNAVPKR